MVRPPLLTSATAAALTLTLSAAGAFAYGPALPARPGRGGGKLPPLAASYGGGIEEGGRLRDEATAAILVERAVLGARAQAAADPPDEDAILRAAREEIERGAQISAHERESRGPRNARVGVRKAFGPGGQP